MIALTDGPYWANVGLVVNPFLIPLCWQKKFSTMSELKNPGFKVLPFFKTKLQIDIKPINDELTSSLVSLENIFF